MGQKLRIGMIGCGMIAQVKHVPALLYHKDRAELAAFSDVNLATAEKLAKESGVPGVYATEDYRRILEDRSIDVVHICTPNTSHCDITVAALEAGKHVMCEKPMAHTSEAAKRMVDAAARTGKKLSISYQNRFRSDSQAVHAYCKSGELGEIYFAKAHALRRKGVPTWGVFTQMKAQGGGPLIDIGTHALDLTLWQWTTTTWTTSRSPLPQDEGQPGGQHRRPGFTGNTRWRTARFGFVRMKNGATVFLESSWALNLLDVKEAVTTVCGTIGGAAQYVVKPGKYSYAVNTVRHGDLVTIRPDDPAMYSRSAQTSENEVMVEAPRREMDQWLDAILNDHDPVVTPHQGYVVSRILEAVYESSATGRPVFF